MKEVIEWIFKHNQDDDQKYKLIVSKDLDRKNALHYATMHPNANTIDLLYQYVFDVNEKTKYDYTALHFAASRNENLSITNYLIKVGANLNALTINGDTPLMLAAKRKYWDIVRLLAENGANTENLSDIEVPQHILKILQDRFDKIPIGEPSFSI